MTKKKRISVSEEELEQEMKDYTPEMYRRRDINCLIIVVFVILACVFVSGINVAIIGAILPALLWLIGLAGLGLVLLFLLDNRGGNFEKSYKLFLKRQIRRRKASQTVCVGIIQS